MVKDTMTRDEIMQAARALADHLKLDPLKGNVGSGKDRLYVYIFGRWHGPQISEWQGLPVQWETNMGRPVAAPAR